MLLVVLNIHDALCCASSAASLCYIASSSVASRDSSCRDTLWTPAPVDDLCFIYLKACVIGGRETRGGTNCAIDIEHPIADSTDQMMMIVTDTDLEACGRPCWLYPPK